MTTHDSGMSSARQMLSGLSRPQMLSAGAMLVVAVAAFLPWYSVLGISASGMRGDGKLTLLAALAGLAALTAATVGVAGRSISSTLCLAVSGVGAALTTLTALVDLNDFAAIGLYLTLLAGMTWVAAVAWEFTERQRGQTAGGPEPTPGDDHN